MKKKLFLVSILFLPTSIWLFLELSTINSKRLPMFGPKRLDGKDTVYYTAGSTFKEIMDSDSGLKELKNFSLDTIDFPLFAVSFIKQNYKTENYRMAALSEYIQFKKEKIANIPFIIITECDGMNAENCFREFELLNKKLPSVHNFYWNSQSFDSLNKSFFIHKPTYVDYSFFALIDTKRHIRGYYDARYISEIKRLIEEYQHLRLKHEKKTLLNQNKIENK